MPMLHSALQAAVISNSLLSQVLRIDPLGTKHLKSFVSFKQSRIWGHKNGGPSTYLILKGTLIFIVSPK
jgi:hypothetical protein